MTRNTVKRPDNLGAFFEVYFSKNTGGKDQWGLTPFISDLIIKLSTLLAVSFMLDLKESI